MSLTAEEFLEIADHTLLAPETTPAEVEGFLRDARTLGVRRVCVSPTLLPSAVDNRGPLEIVTVVGFPSGVHATAAKALEARIAGDGGADEIDAVLDRGRVRAGEWRGVSEEIRALREAAESRVLKVILETATLTDAEITRVCQLAVAEGADFVKTSTGMHPAGGASAHAVRLMSDAVGGEIGVKASGGIRDARTVRELADAGATRFGVSATAAIIAEWEGVQPAPAAPRAGY